MNELLKFEQKQDRLLFGLACAAAAISFAVLAFSSYMDKFGVVTRALNVAVTGALLIVSGWMYHRQPDHFRKAFLLRTAAFLFPVIDEIVHQQDQFKPKPAIVTFLLALAPGAAVLFMIFRKRKTNRSLMRGLWLFVPLWIVSEIVVQDFGYLPAPVKFLFLLKGFLWVYLLFYIDRKKPDQKTTEALCWHAWNANAALIFAGWYFSLDNTLSGYAYQYWVPLLVSGLPFLLTAYQRILAEPEKCRAVPIQAFLKQLYPYRVYVYFAGCMVLYIAFGCRLNDLLNSLTVHYISMCAYYLLLPILVYWMESRAQEKKSGSLKGQKVSYSAMAVFAAACILSALTMKSATKAMYDNRKTGGRKSQESSETLQETTDTEGSAGIAPESSPEMIGTPEDFPHNTEGKKYYVSKEDEKLFFIPSDDDDEEPEFSKSFRTSGIGYSFYENKLCLCLFVIAVTALSIMLIRRNTDHPSADRLGIYLSAGYLIRMAVFLYYAALLSLPEVSPLPFFCHYLVEAVMLGAFLTVKPETDALF